YEGGNGGVGAVQSRLREAVTHLGGRRLPVVPKDVHHFQFPFRQVFRCRSRHVRSLLSRFAKIWFSTFGLPNITSGPTGSTRGPADGSRRRWPRPPCARRLPA